MELISVKNKNLDEIAEELLPIKKQIYTEYKESECYDNMEFADFSEQFHSIFYDKVISVISKLGSLTEINGHSRELDFYKVKFYGLINL